MPATDDCLAGVTTEFADEHAHERRLTDADHGMAAPVAGQAWLRTTAMPPNKGMKLTNLSAAPGTHTDRSAASCPRGTTDGGTGSQLIPGVLRTYELKARSHDGQERSDRGVDLQLIGPRTNDACDKQQQH